MTGRLIVVEGIDGAGTTTQAERIGQLLRAMKLPVHVTREPSQGPIGVELRKILAGAYSLDPASVALLFAADRVDHLHREIVPRLQAGVHVVSDRYLLSSLAYQTLALDRETVLAFNRCARKPDLTLLLDVPVDVAARRRRARGGAAELYDDDDLQAQVAAAYRREAERLREAGEPIVVIDGSPEADTVFAACAEAVKTCLARPARSS